MYAIVEISGQQFKVEKGQKIYVYRLAEKEESQVVFDKVLLTDDQGKVVVGKPLIEGMTVTAKILEHVKGDKVLVFKKKRRKGYQKLRGHRQAYTLIQIIDVKAGRKVAPKAPVEKKVEVAKAEKPATKAPLEKKAKVAKAEKPATKSATKTKSSTASKAKATTAKKTDKESSKKTPVKKATTKTATEKKTTAPKKKATTKKTETKA